MIIGVDSITLTALMAVCVLAILAFIGLYLAIRANAPDALVHWKAKRKGLPVCRVHFKGRNVRDYIAEEDKDESGLNPNTWIVPGL